MNASEKTPLVISIKSGCSWHELSLCTGGATYNDGIRCETEPAKFVPTLCVLREKSRLNPWPSSWGKVSARGAFRLVR